MMKKKIFVFVVTTIACLATANIPCYANQEQPQVANDEQTQFANEDQPQFTNEAQSQLTNEEQPQLLGEEQSPLAINEEQSQKEPELDLKKLSEAFGNFIGKNLHSPGIEFDVETFITGIRNGVAGKPSPMTEQEYEESIGKLQILAFQRMSDENLKAANDYLEKNKNEEGVKEIEAAKLQYRILQEGTGTAVEENGRPSINYEGRYIDGTVFGSSQDNGGPISISLDQTIPGFSKGLKGMKEGEKRTLYIHPDYGYGTAGHLQPNALLIFDVELLQADTPKENDDQVGDDDEDDEDDEDEEEERGVEVNGEAVNHDQEVLE